MKKSLKKTLETSSATTDPSLMSKFSQRKLKSTEMWKKFLSEKDLFDSNFLMMLRELLTNLKKRVSGLTRSGWMYHSSSRDLNENNRNHQQSLLSILTSKLSYELLPTCSRWNDGNEPDERSTSSSTSNNRTSKNKLHQQASTTKSGSKTRPADAYKHVCPETRTSTRNARIPNKPWVFTRNDGSRNADDVSARLQPNEDGSHAWNGRNDGCSNEDSNEDSNASNKRCFWRSCLLTTVQRTDQQSWVRQFWRWRQEEQDRRPHLPICWEDRWTWKCSKNHWNDHWPRNGRPRVFNEFSDAAQREDQRGYWVASRRTSRRLVD